MDLSNVSTADLVGELDGREGVDVTYVEPYAGMTINVEGPVVVLVVED